ncbi:Hypothetical predicted protein [Olea europaea subsp. europaea]|uniref:Uncharacterized protein n=1 Tax=Olea europaea subsp. europaea TaxID=158383 RepID=A0A8S0QGU3_OLEEU|nr:Hypothetical predicted protein [Olea europaea subsp. europaea]
MTKRKEKGDERVKRPTPIYLHLTPPTHLLLFAPICSAITRPSAKLHVGVGNIREHGEGEERVLKGIGDELDCCRDVNYNLKG